MEAAAVTGVPAGQGHWDPEQWDEVVGGLSPTQVSLTITGAKMELAPGAVKKGDIVEFRVVARVGGFDSDDKIDSNSDTVVDNHLKYRARAKSVSIARKLQEAV